MTTTAVIPDAVWPIASGIDRTVVTIALIAITTVAGLTTLAIDARQGALVLLGATLGLTLYHASFGFTGGWRAFVAKRNAAGLRAQMLAIALSSLLVMPLLAQGEAFGHPLVGAFGPVGVSVVVGAFLFGVGMQLGGGCGSGTLFTVGGGNARMLITLLFFIVGAVVGTAYLPWWASLPNIGVVRLPSYIGLWPTSWLQIAVLGAVAGLATWAERRHGVATRPSIAVGNVWQRALLGPWSLVTGAVTFAVLSGVTLVVAGHPWSITFAFSLWGAKALAATGFDVASWPFWTWPMPARALQNSVLADTTSVMDFGTILGAMLGAGLAVKFAPEFRIPWRSLLAAIVGGLLMGFGARLAFGCNIGALLSGIASGSLHGWVWFGSAFAGSLIGVRLRSLFHLAN